MGSTIRKKKMMLDDFIALIPEEDKDRIDKLVEDELKKQNIMNTVVNFELAKLLKEKGYDNPCKRYYNYNGSHLFSSRPRTDDKNLTKAPTIADVVMWLYEKHGIWITVRINGVDKTFDYSIHSIKLMRGSLDNIELAGYITPTKAYSAAIEYTLKHLIK